MDIEQLVFGTVIVTVAAGIGGLTGFGFALVSTPLFLLIGLPLPTVVALNMAFGISTRLPVAIQLRRQVDYLRVSVIILGTLPGMAVGLLLLDTVNSSLLKKAVGVAVLVAAVALATSRPTGRKFSTPASFGVGSIAGALGIVGSLNGVPPAVMYAREGRGAISTLADMAAIVVASSAITGILVVLNQIGDMKMVLIGVVFWLPVALLTTVVSTRLAVRLPVQAFRSAVIVLIAAGGMSVLLSPG